MSQPNEGQDRIDYRETADVTEVHAAILRENAEPSAETTPIPTWLSILGAGALCWAGVYLGMFHGGFNPSVYNEYESSPVAFFPLPQKKGGDAGGPVVEQSLAVLGESVYKNNCAGCHQQNGSGGSGIPPLAGSEWVDGAEANEKRLAAIVLKGLQGPISVKGAQYQGVMQPWEALGPKKIAAALTYVRQAWGNKAGEITEAQIAAAKKEFASQSAQWTVDQIKQIPLDAKLEGGSAGGAPAAAAPAAPDAKAADAPKQAEAKSAGAFDLTASVSNGKNTYALTCGSCHQPTGLGISGAFPPLSGTDFVTGDPRRLVAISLKGVTGPIKVGDKQFASVMPSPDLTFPMLKDDAKLADVLNYVRNSFGNKSDKPVTPELVAAVRAEFAERKDPWTEADLLSFPPAK